MSKLGYFILDSYSGLFEELQRARPRVIKTGDPGMLSTLHRLLGNDVIYIGRNFAEIDDLERWDSGRVLSDPRGAAHYWVDAFRPAMLQAPYAYWESFNEVSRWDAMPQYGLFEAERQRLMAAEGFRACVGNFATGCPPITPDDNDPWAHMYPALEACHQYGNLLGLHEYGGLWMDLWYGPNQHNAVVNGQRVPFPADYHEGWLFGRYRKVWRHHIAAHGWTNVRIVLTELGLDRAGTVTTDVLTHGANVGPWQQCRSWWSQLDGRPDAEQFYVEQLQWADRQMHRDAYVVGATIFCRGAASPVWREWSVEGEVGRRLDEYTRADHAPWGTHQVTAPTGLFLRTRPGGTALAVLPFGERVRAFDTAGEWTYLETSAGLRGYAMRVWLEPV